MANKQHHSEAVDELDEVGKAIGTAEAFVEKHKNYVFYAIIVVLALVLAYFWWSNHLKEQDKEAQSAIFVAEQLFAQDSLQLALGGGGSNGFVSIVENYAHTSTANLACAYAGVCYLRLGKYDDAMAYLKKFSADDELISPAIVGAIGDCYSDQKNYDEALSYYKKAARKKNNITTPFYLKKEGVILETQNKMADALEIYKQIKSDYPSSAEAVTINKDITRAQVRL